MVPGRRSSGCFTSESDAEAAADARPGAEDLLALDVGGANIKVADGRGWAQSEPFELWRRRAELPAALRELVHPKRPRRVVVTMTGEIADCYGSRREGVADIIAAVRQAVGPACTVGIYLVDGSIVTPDDALRRPLDAAASNWHAVARFAAACVGAGRGLVVDVGSTTTDIVPLRDGAVVATARDDVGRLAAGELVYTGVERTPVAAIVRSLPWRGRMRPVVSERFAESRDIWLLLGCLAEDATNRGTADGGPATREAAGRRLARMLLADPDDVTVEEAVAMARRCADAQARLVTRALVRVAEAQGGPPRSVVLAGHGDCLARRALRLLGWPVELVPLGERSGEAASRAAPAHALAVLCRGGIA